MVSLEEAWSTRADCQPDLFLPLWHGSEPCVEGELLEEISAENGLRCCMAPILFNLYTDLLMECWTTRVEEQDGVGIQLK